MAHLHRDEDFDLRGALQEIKRLQGALLIITEQKQQAQDFWKAGSERWHKEKAALEVEIEVMKRKTESEFGRKVSHQYYGEKLSIVVNMLESIDMGLEEHRKVNEVIEFIKKI